LRIDYLIKNIFSVKILITLNGLGVGFVVFSGLSDVCSDRANAAIGASSKTRLKTFHHRGTEGTEGTEKTFLLLTAPMAHLIK